MRPIRFGTEGWRAVLADEYTFSNVRVVARTVAGWFRRQTKQGPVAIGYDTRFMGDRFAAAVADELAAAGVEPRVCSGPLPTPATSYYVVERGMAGSVIVSASHNTAEYNGIKVKSQHGASLGEEDARWIDQQANDLLISAPEEPAPAGEHTYFDAKEDYLRGLLSIVDRDAITSARLRVVADCMHGAGGGYFDEALRRVGCAEVRTLHTDPDPTFGWKHPEPICPNLETAIRLTADPTIDIGLATDGDADRFGMMAQGEYIDVQRTITFILYHLLKNRGWRGRVVRTVSVTSMVDKLCKHFGCTVHETAVGFKYIAPEMVRSDDVILGVEESGGLAFRGGLPDRDGTLTALTVCEALAVEGKPLHEVLSDAFSITGGRMFYGRVDLPFRHDQRDRVQQALRSFEPDELAGGKVESANHIDGAKLVRQDGSWLLMRLSGTEPLVRTYAEGQREADVQALLTAAKDLVLAMAGG